MRYNQIRECDIANGEGVGVALFVQGCRFGCPNCFNSDTWDFNGGKEWTDETKGKFLNLINRDFIKRVTILGGEPLSSPNNFQVRELVKEIKERYPNKTIWLYTGYTYEELEKCREKFKTLFYVDVLVDGRFVEELKDLSLAYRGSSNQRIIDVKKTIKTGNIVTLN